MRKIMSFLDEMNVLLQGYTEARVWNAAILLTECIRGIRRLVMRMSNIFSLMAYVFAETGLVFAETICLILRSWRLHMHTSVVGVAPRYIIF